MASEQTTPINEEENEKAATRNPNDTNLGPTNDNKDAGEMEAWQRAYDASVPSSELNLDSGDFAGGPVGEDDKDKQDRPNLKQ
ncbi:hypothetical protein HH214_04520 [Mucilaginibacter robiniae]|uniref:Uncharacterized protein n=1 Tax=Mucilaginibacter robiniae TaxID=2728022 RepID=A0A7L5E327_9SPHI|nr:hypothetical protein [Mucilaginibacter robiniae]QJD95193.1 hypothetical protein HH214_04520 [Mucilaginibacter robiniae]